MKPPTGMSPKKKSPPSGKSAPPLTVRSPQLSPTEQRNPRSANLDRLSVGAAIELMLTEEAQVTLVDAIFNPIPQVTVTAEGVPITENTPAKLTAYACFTPICYQWYRTDSSGRSFKELIPGATGMEYEFPNPVPCGMLAPPGDYFMVEVFDSGRIPHVSTPVRVYGDCQP